MKIWTFVLICVFAGQSLQAEDRSQDLVQVKWTTDSKTLQIFRIALLEPAVRIAVFQNKPRSFYYSQSASFNHSIEEVAQSSEVEKQDCLSNSELRDQLAEFFAGNNLQYAAVTKTECGYRFYSIDSASGVERTRHILRQSPVVTLQSN